MTVEVVYKVTSHVGDAIPAVEEAYDDRVQGFDLLGVSAFRVPDGEARIIVRVDSSGASNLPDEAIDALTGAINNQLNPGVAFIEVREA